MQIQLEQLLEKFKAIQGRMTVLTGAGISAESGVPTFRGPEGYWTVGSQEYRPEEMATNYMFGRNPWEVWAWYLYRRGVCMAADPNQGHLAVARIEPLVGERFRLITQNVDGIHLRAGNTIERTYQIHGNIQYMRCSVPCSIELFPIPETIGPKPKGQDVTEEEKGLLKCPLCGSMSRPHVLWFDESYDEPLFRFESSHRWAQQTDLLLVVGTAGATNLPMQIGSIVSRREEAILMDINPSPNPFRDMALNHPNGIALEGLSGEILPEILRLLQEE